LCIHKDEFAALKECPTRELSQFKKKLDGSSDDEKIKGLVAKVLW